MSSEPPSTEPPRPRPSFRRENLAWLTLLLIATLGLYMLWWMYRQTQVVNAHSPAHAVPSWLVHGAMISVPAVVVARLAYGQDVPAEPPVLLLVVNMVALVTLMAWPLLLRRGINALSGATMGERTWVSLPVTLLLSVFQLSPLYMQFIINRVLEQRGRS